MACLDAHLYEIEYTGKLKYLRIGGLFLTEYVKKSILTTGFRYLDILITETLR
jgi:hypothetical protein